MRHAESNKPPFLLPGLFVLLPLLLLTGLGLYSLRQDRSIVAVEASARCAPIADLCAHDIASAISEAPNAIHSISSISVASNGDLVAIAGSIRKARRVECPLPHPLPHDELSSNQAFLWDEASTNNIPALRQFINLNPPPQFLAQALYNLAFADKSPEIFRDTATNRDAFSEAGLPLWLLAESQCLLLVPSDAAAISLCSNAVNYPSFATPILLGKAPPDVAAPWLKLWNADEKARSLYVAARSKLPSDHSFWVDWQDQRWLIFPIFGDSLLPASGDDVSNAVLRVIRGRHSDLPPYAGLSVQVAGRAIVDSPKDHLLLAESFRAGLVPTDALVHVRVFLADPALLYAQQRRRTLWFAAIILASTFSATVALVSVHRAFQQQLRLSEMKTNFVSSVSHELRAPIASMRLLAEGLDRGKITDPPKQKEYYKLLSQESRRLSTLIENILDYSRIDQNRKIYEKQPTDLPALVQQTIALMTPVAADCRVSLVAPPPNSLADPTVVCDGLAIQQALINLLDNAIKHSPPDAAVTIGLERANGSVSLWVEDRGPGIPLHEREKIFERFYRLGAELRRETQGIGIGLTIVKHIVEGHSGRVFVTGEMGQGSRFTMEFPADGNTPTA